MNRFVKIFFPVCFLLTACTTHSDDPSDDFEPSRKPKDCVMQSRGGGGNFFTYSKYVPLGDKPVTVYYYIPTTGDMKQMPVLFAMHGAERSGLNQINAWKWLAEANEFIVVAPQFSKENGYLENDYQFGGVFTSKTFSELRDPEQWTYRLIEELFDYVKNETDNVSEKYNIFGHSAGGQFVHRFLLATPGARVNRAVAANPGSWSFPLPEGLTGTDNRTYGWPYSLLNTPFSTESDLRRFFSHALFVQIGTADTVRDENFPTDAASMAQGGSRFERAHAFYDSCVEISRKISAPLHTRIVEVEGAGHSSLQMVYGKAKVTASKTDDRGPGNAYDLLFN